MKMLSVIKGLFFLLVSIQVFSACSPKTTKITTDVQPGAVAKVDTVPLPVFDGTYWRLTELYGNPISDENPKHGGFIMFRSNGQMTASAGCNSLTGTYTIKPDMGISFGLNMATTLINCPNQVREDQLKKLLSEVKTYRRTGSRLQLYAMDAAPAARFEQVMDK